MTDDYVPRKVGVIGLGKMGSALADALLANGFEVAVWNRTTTKAERFAKAGAKLASSATDAARSSDVLVVSLSDYAAIRESIVVDGVGQALRKKVLVDLTGLRSEDLHEFAAWTRAHDISFLKGIILSYPADVRSGVCSVLYGGDRAVFDATVPVLRAMGGHPVHIGEDAEDGAKMARAFYCFLIPVLVAFLHGAAVTHGMGLSVDSYISDIVLPSLKGPAVTGMLERLATASLARRYDEDVQATLGVWNHGLANFIHNLTSARLDPGLLPAAKTLLEEAVSQGFGELDLASVFESLLRKKT